MWGVPTSETQVQNSCVASQSEEHWSKAGLQWDISQCNLHFYSEKNPRLVSATAVSESFLSHVSKAGRKVLEQAPQYFESGDQDTLIDVLDSHECYQIEPPTVVHESWRLVLQTNLWHHKKMVCEKCMKYILKLTLSVNPAQTCEARHLTRYVGGWMRRAYDCLSSVLELIYSLEVTSPSPSLKSVWAKTLKSKFHYRRQANTCRCSVDEL